MLNNTEAFKVNTVLGSLFKPLMQRTFGFRPSRIFNLTTALSPCSTMEFVRVRMNTVTALLRTVIAIPPHTYVTIETDDLDRIRCASTAKFRVNVRANSGSKIVLRDSVPLYVTTPDLDPDFAEGWRKLPNELKIRVLAYNLAFDSPIESCCISPRLWRLRMEEGHWPSMLLAHLAMGPDIAAAATETFYHKNTFHVNLEYRMHGIGLMNRASWKKMTTDALVRANRIRRHELPSPTIQTLVRRLEISHYLNNYSWETLRTSNGIYKLFSSLRHVTIRVVMCETNWAVWIHRFQDFGEWSLRGPEDAVDSIPDPRRYARIQFHCDGEVEFDRREWYSICCDGSGLKVDSEEFETYLRSAFEFGVNDEQASSRSE